MSSARIDLVDESGRHVPGGRVEGVVSWVLDAMPRSAEVALVWHTEGKGSRDSQIVRKVTFDAPDATDSRTFSLDLPPTPWSFSGALVSLVWAVELAVTPASGREIVSRRTITVGPDGVEVDLTALQDARARPGSDPADG